MYFSWIFKTRCTIGISLPSILKTTISPTRMGSSTRFVRKRRSPLWNAGSMLPLGGDTERQVHFRIGYSTEQRIPDAPWWTQHLNNHGTKDDTVLKIGCLQPCDFISSFWGHSYSLTVQIRLPSNLWQFFDLSLLSPEITCYTIIPSLVPLN